MSYFKVEKTDPPRDIYLAQSHASSCMHVIIKGSATLNWDSVWREQLQQPPTTDTDALPGDLPTGGVRRVVGNCIGGINVTAQLKVAVKVTDACEDGSKLTSADDEDNDRAATLLAVLADGDSNPGGRVGGEISPVGQQRGRPPRIQRIPAADLQAMADAASKKMALLQELNNSSVSDCLPDKSGVKNDRVRARLDPGTEIVTLRSADLETTLQSTADRLNKVVLLSQLGLLCLERRCMVRRVAAGTRLVNERERATDVFIVVRGECRVYQSAQEEALADAEAKLESGSIAQIKSRSLATLGPKSIIGDMPVLCDHVNVQPASVITATPVEVLVISASALEQEFSVYSSVRRDLRSAIRFGWIAERAQRRVFGAVGSAELTAEEKRDAAEKMLPVQQFRETARQPSSREYSDIFRWTGARPDDHVDDELENQQHIHRKSGADAGEPHPSVSTLASGPHELPAAGPTTRSNAWRARPEDQLFGLSWSSNFTQEPAPLSAVTHHLATLLRNTTIQSPGTSSEGFHRRLRSREPPCRHRFRRRFRRRGHRWRPRALAFRSAVIAAVR